MHRAHHAMKSKAAGSRSSRAFTIIELLLVLAIVVLMMGAAIPALRRPLAKSEIGRAALELKQRMSETRLAAIQTARTHYFVFEPGAGHYYSGPLATPTAEAMETLPPQIHFVANGATTLTPVDDSTDLSGELPASRVSHSAAPSSTSPSPSPLPREDASALIATEAIMFRPDGRTSSTTIWLHRDDFKISLHVRGLTGECTIGSVERISAPDEATDSLNSYSNGSDEGFADRPEAPWPASDGKPTR